MKTFSLKNTLIAGAFYTTLPTIAMADSVMLDQAKLGNERVESSFNFQLSKQNSSDDYIGSIYGNVQLTDEIRVSTQLDSEGYLEFSTGYGFNIGSTYIEPYVSYGKTDFIDIKTTGAFVGIMINDSLMVFADTSYEWRTANSDLGLGIQEDLLDENEWRSALGASYTLNEKLIMGYTFHHNRIIDSGALSYENDNRNSHELSVAFNVTNEIAPYVQYTHGPHRVNQGSVIEDSNSFEAGINFRF